MISAILFLTYAKADPPALLATAAAGQATPAALSPATAPSSTPATSAARTHDVEAELEALKRELGG